MGLAGHREAGLRCSPGEGPPSPLPRSFSVAAGLRPPPERTGFGGPRALQGPVLPTAGPRRPRTRNRSPRLPQLRPCFLGMWTAAAVAAAESLLLALTLAPST